MPRLPTEFHPTIEKKKKKLGRTRCARTQQAPGVK